MHCVPFSLKDLNIFAIGGFLLVYQYSRLKDIELSTTGEDLKEILGSNDDLLVTEALLLSDGSIVPALDIRSTTRDFATWFSSESLHNRPHDEIVTALVSRVSVILSAQFRQIIASPLDDRLGQNFRILAQTSSALYDLDNGRYAGYTVFQLARLRSYAGSQVLCYLERALSARAIEGASLEVLQSLFLVLAGAIISIGCMESLHVLDVVSHSRPNCNFRF